MINNHKSYMWNSYFTQEKNNFFPHLASLCSPRLAEIHSNKSRFTLQVTRSKKLNKVSIVNLLPLQYVSHNSNTGDPGFKAAEF